MRISIAVLTLLAAAAVFAADLGKYEKWDESPSGYFMTKAEREQWTAVKSEEEAEKFVAGFYARRDAGFKDEVTKRARMADKYLSTPKTQGSKTLRGKVVILMGPPAAVNSTDRTRSDVKRDNPMMAAALSNSGTPGFSAGGDGAAQGGGTIGTARIIRTHTLTYKDITFLIESDNGDGPERFANGTAAKEAEAAFEKAAQASIRQ